MSFKVKGNFEGDRGQNVNNRTILKEVNIVHVDHRQHNSKPITTIMSNITQKRYFLCNGPTGRLGNQLFDFASSLGIASTLNYTFVIRSTHPLLKLFDIDQHIVMEKPANLRPIPLKQWRNNSWGRNGTYFAHNLTLAGYYRIWGYFGNITNNVRKSLTIQSRFLDKARTFLRLNTPRNRTLIGIHVRRGDFLRDKLQEFGKAVASKKYIRTAMKYFEKRYNDSFFVVVSDDKRWCKTNLTGTDVVVSQSNEAIVDLAIMTLCHHTIITSGTFGWWGAWLAGGEVVYWTGFPKPGSQNEKEILFKGEYYPPQWIGIDSD